MEPGYNNFPPNPPQPQNPQNSPATPEPGWQNAPTSQPSPYGAQPPQNYPTGQPGGQVPQNYGSPNAAYPNPAYSGYPAAPKKNSSAPLIISLSVTAVIVITALIGGAIWWNSQDNSPTNPITAGPTEPAAPTNPAAPTDPADPTNPPAPAASGDWTVHEDLKAGLKIGVPPEWVVDTEIAQLVYGSTLLTKEHATVEGFALVGKLDGELNAASETSNEEAAKVLALDMGQFFLAPNADRINSETHQVSSKVGDGWAASYKLIPSPSETTMGGTVYAAVVEQGGQRWWMVYLAIPSKHNPDMTADMDMAFADQFVGALSPL